ncbi:MAG: hypothetical protein WKG06_16375 [Segetibacter sp.]
MYEGLSKGNDKEGNEKDYNYYINALYNEYPQLVPFSGLTAKMKLIFKGVSDDNTQAVAKEIKQCDIQWVTDADGDIPVADIAFIKKGGKYEATVNVEVKGWNKFVVSNEKMVFKNPEGVGKELALRLFGKSGARVFEKIDAGN